MKRAFVGLICLFLADCNTKVPVVTPEIQAKMRQELVNGQAVLDCNLGCVGSYGWARPQLRALYETENWDELATLVMKIGFQEDQSYFYLGRAAEGLGAYDAALKYYKVAGYLSTAPIGRCASGELNVCDGFRFPRDIYPRIRTVQVEMSRNQVASHARYSSPIISAASEATDAGPGATRGLQPNPLPRPAPVVQTASKGNDWVRPPPVTH